MLKRSLALLTTLIMLLHITSCGGSEPFSPQEADSVRVNSASPAETEGDANVPLLPVFASSQVLSEDNPIDRAFERIADEKQGELEGNVVFAYLYAWEWYNEHLLLSEALLGENTPEIQWKSYLYRYQIMETAMAYAKNRTTTHKAPTVFEEIARFYKLMVLDSLNSFQERGVNMDMRANEETLYRRLKDVNYDEYIPNNFDISYIDKTYEDPYFNRQMYPMPVYAALPDEDIHLTFAPPFGAVLSVKGEEYLYAWSNGALTPRAILPQLSRFDFDGDGNDELAVILYVGSGTGVSVEELHIVELTGEMEDIMVTGETIEHLLFHQLSAAYDPVADKVTVRLDDQTVTIDASWVDKEKSNDFRTLDVRSLIGFIVENGALKVHISIGLSGFDFVTPFDYVDFYADVHYTEASGVSLSNCRIE